MERKTITGETIMIVGFFGDIREGKTISAIKTLHELQEGGYRIYTTMPVSFPHTLIDINFLINISEGIEKLPINAVIFVDEITLFLDSRVSSNSKASRIISYMLLQSGHLGSDKEIGLYFLYTTQYPRLIDVRLWLLTQVKVICSKSKFLDFTIIKNKWIFDKIVGSFVIESEFVAEFYHHLYDTQFYVLPPRSKYDK